MGGEAGFPETRPVMVVDMGGSDKATESDDAASIRELRALLRVAAEVVSPLDVDQILQWAVRSAVEALEVDVGSIYTIDGAMLVLEATHPPLPDDFPREHRLAHLSDHLRVQRCIELASPVAVVDAVKEAKTPEERLVVESRGLVSALFVPLIDGDRAIGALIVHTTEAPRVFSKEETGLVADIAREVAAAVVRARDRA